MTKQERIAKEWESIGVNIPMGVNMETGFSSPIDENDISKILNHHNTPYNKLDFKRLGGTTLVYRPKSLQGIENNNGWIKIESEDDLPKERCACWTISDGEIIMNTFNTFEDNEFTFDHEKVTYYQKIIEPLKPLY